MSEAGWEDGRTEKMKFLKLPQKHPVFTGGICVCTISFTYIFKSLIFSLKKVSQNILLALQVRKVTLCIFQIPIQWKIWSSQEIPTSIPGQG